MRKWIIIPIILIAGMIVYNGIEENYNINELGNIKYKEQQSLIVKLYKVKTYTQSVTNLVGNYFGGGLWFFDDDILTYLIIRYIPQNETHFTLNYEAKKGQIEVVPQLTTILNYSINEPGKQLNVLMFPYKEHVLSNEYRDYFVTYIAMNDIYENKLEPGYAIYESYYIRNQQDLKTWYRGGTGMSGFALLSTEGYSLRFDPSIFDIQNFRRYLYALLPTYYKEYSFSNGIPAFIIFDNIIIYNKNKQSYDVYTVVSATSPALSPINLIAGMQYIIKYKDSTGILQNDTVYQKIPILYLHSPLSTVSFKHIDILFAKLKPNGILQFYLAGGFFYDPSDTTATIDNKLRVIYDIPGLTPGATCSISQDLQILPTNINPYTTKVYVLTPKVEVTSYVDPNTQLTTFVLKSPIRLAFWDPSTRLLAFITIRNVTMPVRTNIQVTDLCHYQLQDINVTLDAVYDLSGIIPNDDAAKITMIDFYSPRAQYYGTLVFRVGTYDSIANYNPAKIVTYRLTGTGPELYINQEISPIGSLYREKILQERMIHTWYGSPLLVFTQSDYNGISVSRVQWEVYIPTYVQNITYTPKMFTRTIEYNYTILPIEITYIKYYPEEPDVLNNVLVKITITDPNVLANIAAADARDVRFFLDNTRAGDYWQDPGLTYGIEEYIPGQKLVVYVLIPTLYANQTTTIYMYSGFKYAQPVARKVEDLLAAYPVLVPVNS